jgi:hypothetical protein
MPFASRKAESHFVNAIEKAKLCGAGGLLGQAHLGLGQLYKARKMNSEATEQVAEAITVFKELQSETHYNTAVKVLETCRREVAS